LTCCSHYDFVVYHADFPGNASAIFAASPHARLYNTYCDSCDVHDHGAYLHKQFFDVCAHNAYDDMLDNTFDSTYDDIHNDWCIYATSKDNNCDQWFGKYAHDDQIEPQ